MNFSDMSLAEAVRTLGLPAGKALSPEIVKSAYRRRALETHPDRGGDMKAFKRVHEAYEVLRHIQQDGTFRNRKTHDFGGFSPFYAHFSSRERRAVTKDDVVAVLRRYGVAAEIIAEVQKLYD